MLEYFFSVNYKDRGDLFEGLSIWNDEKYRQLQGTYPVISLSFASVKERNFEMTRKKICQLIANLYDKNSFLLSSGVMNENDIRYFKRVSEEMDDSDASLSLHQLADYLSRYYGKKVIILLDEYDTPMQEAYVNGFWNEIVAFTRSLFNSTFKTNPYLERAIMTGITRVSKESIFSDLNNLEVVTTTSDEYASAFGFTEKEVFAALEECGYSDQKKCVKQWYDGFIFGHTGDIYNPWSILNFLDKGRIGTYWANTSSNSLVGKLIREGDLDVKNIFEDLLKGKSIHCQIDEQIVYNQLDGSGDAIFSLLLASGYLKVLNYEQMNKIDPTALPMYELALTNLEVEKMFYGMVREWFKPAKYEYNSFVKALLLGDLDAMNDYMNIVSEEIFSSFDTGKRPSKSQPERFYHGFVLGLMVDLADRYIITSNRESGFGRYDIMIEPKQKEAEAFIIEFKVFNPRREASLEETVQNALAQIEEKKYAAELIKRGIAEEHINKYGFAFKGKEVLIG